MSERMANIGSSVKASQNFLTSRTLINRIISLAGIEAVDHIVEIGAGKGHITRSLVSKCERVTAIEIDHKLFKNLKNKFNTQANLYLIYGDFMGWNLPATPYKVFSNIPFNRTTAIIRKLTGAANPPEEIWLVIQKGAAKRFSGIPRETLSSLLIKPFFETGVHYYFRREDFHPAPSVDAVLLALKKKKRPDISFHQRGLYTKFITDCTANRSRLHQLLTKKQISTALKMEKLSCDIISGDMLYVQWLCLFRCYAKFTPY